jgi:hypothetical protein
VRPPRKSWALVARAVRELARALRDLDDGLYFDANGYLRTAGRAHAATFQRKVRRASAAARRLSTFVNESEECEMP